MAVTKRDRLKNTSALNNLNRPAMTLGELTDSMALSDDGDTSRRKMPPEGLLPKGKGVIETSGYTLTRKGLVQHEGATFDDWKQIGNTLVGFDGVIQLLIGDWILQGQSTWGQTYDDMMALTGYEYQSIANFTWVASSVPISIRIENLTISHYTLVASLDDYKVKAQLLKQASNNGDKPMPISQFRELVKVAKRELAPSPTRRRDPLGVADYRKNSQAVGKIANRVGQGAKISHEQRHDALSQIQDMRRFLDLLESQLDKG